MITDNIDNIAFAFFSSLVLCSILNDSYIIIYNFLDNSSVKKKINYLKKVFKVIINLSINNYKNDIINIKVLGLVIVVIEEKLVFSVVLYGLPSRCFSSPVSRNDLRL